MRVTRADISDEKVNLPMCLLSLKASGIFLVRMA